VAHPVAETLRHAAALNRSDPRREGNVVCLPDDCTVTVAGDLHGNRQALAKILSSTPLTGDSPDSLILQEIIHGPIDPGTRTDRSIEVLLRAARARVSHPEQVAFLMGNHDVAELTGNEISRGGQPSCKTFREGLAFAFPEAQEEIREALEAFLLSLPLAARCPNGVFMSHSLPSAELAGEALERCLGALERPYQSDDLHRGGGVYEWTWGRRHDPKMIEDLARRLEVSFFVIGHLHVPRGFDWVSPKAMTLASDHERGCVLRMPSSEIPTEDTLNAGVVRVAALGA
jgi:3',5'-cyclic AMP phosphodiesterase CpdA